MNKKDALDAAPIAQRALANLQKTVPQYGRLGSDTREQISKTIVAAYELLRLDELGAELTTCFDMARRSGTQFFRLEQVRVLTALEKPLMLGGYLVRDVIVGMCLATEGRIIAETKFRSRIDVERVKVTVNPPFAEAEETAADSMDQQTYATLIGLHAAIINYLAETALPLPSMLPYQFVQNLPSTVISYRLYDTAGNADAIRDENKIVHPLFCPRYGTALGTQ